MVLVLISTDALIFTCAFLLGVDHARRRAMGEPTWVASLRERREIARARRILAGSAGYSGECDHGGGPAIRCHWCADD